LNFENSLALIYCVISVIISEWFVVDVETDDNLFLYLKLILTKFGLKF